MDLYFSHSLRLVKGNITTYSLSTLLLKSQLQYHNPLLRLLTASGYITKISTHICPSPQQIGYLCVLPKHEQYTLYSYLEILVSGLCLNSIRWTQQRQTLLTRF